MPKIKKQEEAEGFDEDDDLEELEDDEESDTDWDTPPRRIERALAQEKEVETRGRKPKTKPTEEVKRRFGIVGPQPMRIVDTETNELVGEGEFAVIQALTDILERLERIEVQIGALG